MINNLLILLLFSLNLLAQENNKYIMLKPLTWDQLQSYQLDSLKTVEALKLVEICPSNLKIIQEEFEKSSAHMQYIHGSVYIWTEFVNDEDLYCYVKHNKINSIEQEKNKSINPNEYEILNVTQARVLKSALRSVI